MPGRWWTRTSSSLASELVGELAGPVRRRVVDDEHGAVDGRVAAGERGPGAGDDGRRGSPARRRWGGRPRHWSSADSLGRTCGDRSDGRARRRPPGSGRGGRARSRRRGRGPSGRGAASRRSTSAAAATPGADEGGPSRRVGADQQAPGVRVRAGEAGVVADVRPRVHDVLRVAGPRVVAHVARDRDDAVACWSARTCPTPPTVPTTASATSQATTRPPARHPRQRRRR